VNLGIGLSLTSGGRAASPPTSTLNLSFGQKTLAGHGGVDSGYTGTVTITAGNGAGHWAIDTYNRIVPAGTYNAAAPSFSGPYALTVSGNGVSRTVNITMVANAYSVRWREDNQPDLFAGVGNEITRILVNQNTTRAFGDRIICRSGTYNPTAAANWSLGKDNASVPSGVWSGSNWVRIESETAYGAIFPSVTVSGANVATKYIEFYQIQFLRSNVSATDPATTTMIQTASGPTFVKVNQCQFWGESSLRGNPSVESTSLCSAIFATTAGTSDWAIADNTFDTIFRGVQIAGANHTIIGNAFNRMYDDDCQASNVYNFTYSWNTSINKYAALTDTHGDFLQFAFTGLGAGVYAGFQIIGNRMVRGTGTAGSYDGQGIYMGNASEIPAGVTFTGTRIQGNLYIGSMARAISVQGQTDAEISFNTLVTDTGSNYSGYLNAIIMMGEGCTGGQIRNNVLTGTIGAEDGGASGTLTANQASITNTLSSYQTYFASPALGSNNTSMTQVTTDWAMKTSGPLDTAPYKTGAVGTGYVDYVARSTSFPLP
jgi:hypothetical protein